MIRLQGEAEVTFIMGRNICTAHDRSSFFWGMARVQMAWNVE